MRTTKKAQLLEAIKKTGESIDNIAVYWQDYEEDTYDYDFNNKPRLIHSGSVDDLPDREFESGYGGTEGEPCIAYGVDFIYISVQYDGSEWIEAIPRDPWLLDSTKVIPWPGGG